MLPTFISMAADRCRDSGSVFHSWLNDGCFLGHAVTVGFGVKLFMF